MHTDARVSAHTHNYAHCAGLCVREIYWTSFYFSLFFIFSIFSSRTNITLAMGILFKLLVSFSLLCFYVIYTRQKKHEFIYRAVSNVIAYVAAPIAAKFFNKQSAFVCAYEAFKLTELQYVDYARFTWIFSFYFSFGLFFTVYVLLVVSIHLRAYSLLIFFALLLFHYLLINFQIKCGTFMKLKTEQNKIG